MPACVECGAETPRDLMYGAPDDLRCRACVQRLYPVDPIPERRRPRAKPPVTVFLIGAAILVTVLHHSGVKEMDWVFSGPGVWQGQLWRHFTAILPHLSPLHLLFNLLWTWRFGKEIENALGSLRFVGLVIATGVGSSAAEFLIGNYGAGLSGVVYAFFGWLYALRNDEEYAAWQVSPAIVQMFVGWFFICLLLTWFDILPIANVAHGMGAVLGWLLGQAALTRVKALAVTAVGLFSVALALATLYMPWDPGYAAHRVRQAIQQRDAEQMLYWIQQVERNRVWWEEHVSRFKFRRLRPGGG